MEWGLLWYDDTANRSLEEKVRRAAAHYERKYGQPPTLCFVHPSARNGVDRVDEIQVEKLRTIGPNYLWIGVGELTWAPKRSAGARRGA